MAQKYALKGLKPLDCFAGQVRVRGKRVSRQTFSVYAPNNEMKCCATLVKTARTDAHGHFLVETMAEGEYFAKFDFKGRQYVTDFAVIQSYKRCEGSHVELNFSDVDKAIVKTYVDIDDSGDECQPTEPHCFRK